LWILKGRGGILGGWIEVEVFGVDFMGSVFLRKRRWKDVGGDDEGDVGGDLGLLVGGSEGRRMTDLRDLLLEEGCGTYLNPILVQSRKKKTTTALRTSLGWMMGCRT
jgi:hypothetical protein